MKGQGDHGFHRAQVNLDEGVVAGAGGGGLSLELLTAAQKVQMLPHRVVGGPHGGQAGGLGGHDINAGAVIHG